MSETQARTRQSSSSSPAASDRRADILERIVRTKTAEIEHLRKDGKEIEARARAAPEPRDFRGALQGEGSVALIAEVKRRSPGAGEIRPGLDPAALAGEYEEAGASALSVLTDREYFGGSLDDLGAARAAVGIPVLRKDFTLDPVQIREARAAGADAILLIVRILEDAALRELRLLAEELGMAALVEVHGPGELERALATGASLVGINNRDLSTFTTRIETTLDLVAEVPDGITLISESGIRTRDDVARLGEAGVDGVLVGETLLRAPSPKGMAQELSGARKAGRREG